MEYKKVKIEYISKNIKLTKKNIISILNEMGIFDLELIDEFIDNKLDYNTKTLKNDTWIIIFYLLNNKYLNKKIDMIIESVDKIDDEEFAYDISISDYNDEEYKDEWKKYFKTTNIYQNIVVKPSWDNTQDNNEDITIKIDPGMAFGTGTHETTYLCMKEMYDTLLNTDTTDKSLIDIGCGSGILMILAKKLGINNITGIDIDEKIREVAIENLEKNQVNEYNLVIGNLVDNENKKYDYIVSNILFDVLELLLEDIKKICYYDTTLIFSGIIDHKKDTFMQKCVESGFEIININQKNNWISLKLRLKPKNVIAIDGPSSSGKSTISEYISQKMGYNYLNTGAMYRSYAYKLIKENDNLTKDIFIEKYINKLNLQVLDNKFILDDEDITNKLREENIGNLASAISKNKNIRKYMVKLQRELSKNKKIVLDGRDIGSVVFPEAKLKIYLTASPEVRANRRYRELLAKGVDIEYNKVYEDICARDEQDSTREESPLMKMPDSIELNTDNLTIEDIVNEIIRLSKERDML